jgi:SWI/SNF-related matrix-associated actin-dependent regulator of chromatin subfamily A member 2/4
MALVAYLMEFKGNYGPHLIIVPNAVLVNWKVLFHVMLEDIYVIFVSNKLVRNLHFVLISVLAQSELLNWLPSASCIFYVGVKDQRAKLFSQVSCLLFFIEQRKRAMCRLI